MQRFSDWIKKININYLVSLETNLRLKEIHKLKKRFKNIYHANCNHKRDTVNKLILDKWTFKQQILHSSIDLYSIFINSEIYIKIHILYL